MFGPKAFLRAVGTKVHDDLAAAVVILRAYARQHTGTDLGTQADRLATLCHDVKSPGLLLKLDHALSPADHETIKPAQWASIFSRAAEMIGLAASSTTGEHDKSTHAGLRQALKEGVKLHSRAAAPRHPWPADLTDTIAKVVIAAALLNRLHSRCKGWRKLLDGLAEDARFLAGDRSV